MPTFAFFRGTILAWEEGHVYTLAGHDRILWCRSPFLPTNSGVTTKKNFGAKSQALFWHSLVCFVRERDFTHAWGGTSSILGGTGPKMYTSGTGHVIFFWGTILVWVGRFLAWEGTSSDLGSTAPKRPPCHRAWVPPKDYNDYRQTVVFPPQTCSLFVKWFFLPIELVSSFMSQFTPQWRKMLTISEITVIELGAWYFISFTINLLMVWVILWNFFSPCCYFCCLKVFSHSRSRILSTIKVSYVRFVLFLIP